MNDRTMTPFIERNQVMGQLLMITGGFGTPSLIRIAQRLPSSRCTGRTAMVKCP
jgi:hypothetical protein